MGEVIGQLVGRRSGGSFTEVTDNTTLTPTRRDQGKSETIVMTLFCILPINLPLFLGI